MKELKRRLLRELYGVDYDDDMLKDVDEFFTINTAKDGNDYLYYLDANGKDEALIRLIDNKYIEDKQEIDQLFNY